MAPGTTDGGEVCINVNSTPLKGWNPTGAFLNTAQEPNRVLIEKTKHTVSILSDGTQKTGKFELNGYVLPNKNKMSDNELADIRFSNDNQGFYIYREDRLIFGGGWPHRIFAQESHMNLLRVELNFDHQLDDYFEIDIRKSKINLPLKIRNELKRVLAPWRNQAQARYRSNNPHKPKQPSPGGGSQTNIHSGSSSAIARQKGNSTSVKVLVNEKGNSVIRIKNRFGEVEINRASVVEGTDVFVTTSSSLADGMLWDIHISDEDQTVVILNENHEFYKRFYMSVEISPVFVQAMDSLFWALANSELNSISSVAKQNFEELRFCLSNTLRHLADELPDVH